ncbi:MAG: HU family DNA-binding protein [Pseudomonadota bacterium]
MNKNDLISAVADATGMSKTDTTTTIDATITAISQALSRGEEVRLIGFGTFSVSQRQATTARNPRTGDIVNVPASKQPKFKSGKALRESVN